MPDFTPILCLDFDGVLHSYKSGWQGADVIPDDPVPGMSEFLSKAVDHFDVCIFSSRSNQEGGITAMWEWMNFHLVNELGDEAAHRIMDLLRFPTEKPPATVSIDDRCLTFTGIFPSMEQLISFKPWNKILADHPSRKNRD